MSMLNECAASIHHPVQKLNFIRRTIDAYHALPDCYKNLPPKYGEFASQHIILTQLKRLDQPVRTAIKITMREKKLSRIGILAWRAYKYRHAIVLAASCVVLLLGTVIYKHIGPFQNDIKPKSLNTAKVPPRNNTYDIPEYVQDEIWLVEKKATLEIYSNRLQIITSHEVDNIPRQYIAFPKGIKRISKIKGIQNHIAGILYHASESDIVPFKKDLKKSINDLSLKLRHYITRKKLYHYFIDRYGRVYRIVHEAHAANHAGNSIWADEHFSYLNLNHAFLGICFEVKGFAKITSKINPNRFTLSAMDSSTINESQIKSCKELTDWLRLKYNIPQTNCTTHGLASINPKKMLIGYHMDLSHSFPFEKIGLANKFIGSIPSISEFGFDYDNYFKAVMNQKLWPGIAVSYANLEIKSQKAGMSVKQYRETLNKKYQLYDNWQNLLTGELQMTETNHTISMLKKADNDR